MRSARTDSPRRTGRKQISGEDRGRRRRVGGGGGGVNREREAAAIRPDPRLLRQAALEALMRSARTDSPRRTGRKQISGEDRGRRRRVGGGGGGVNREREAAAMC
ncbi:hypothetical protein F511_19270 [Dorcoceras hygrometricum]|uniref:Uncharacterized protein n=1 Tax=Dorcoceras hygrometricum TaxID=472368 RepID=A0A2Z7CTX3_9LAMI|nr:hypothetical protein F511_19270 [Dorcoceras hygrometricum]